jgi:1,4-dihydroxy-2-naphthoate octaprenyltransferase
MQARMTAWLLAMRPRTLPLAVIPVVLGSACAAKIGLGFQIVPALLCLMFALLVQIGANFANDYFDFIKGADDEHRVGPKRAVASGWIQPDAMRRAMYFTFGAAFLVGCGLLPFGGWPLLIVGILSVASGYAYTGGPYPLGYHGWGDLFVIVFFGFVAVLGTFYVQTCFLDWNVFWVSFIPGCLATCILVVNNTRDYETDRRIGKKTLAVRWGKAFSKFEYELMLGIALIIPLVLFLRGFSWPVLLPYLLVRWALRLHRRMEINLHGFEFNQLLASTSGFISVYGFLMAVGILMS